MTTTEAAAWLAARGLRLQPATLTRHLQRGTLVGTKHGTGKRGFWTTTEAALAEFLQTHPPQGWPADAWTHRRPKKGTDHEQLA